MRNSKDLFAAAVRTSDLAAAPVSSDSLAFCDDVVAGKITPTYAAAFRCIGPNCEDPCCGDWDIPVDKTTYLQYQNFLPEKLGSVVQHFVFKNAAGAPDNLYAQIYREPSGCCPFLGADRLCGIQKEYGHQLLSATCSIYPRSFSRVDGELEGSLSLSCPEAARNVLLSPGFMQIEGDLLSGDFRTDNCFELAKNGSKFTHKPYLSFHTVRSLLMSMIRDRSRPLWKRLLLIGTLCKRLGEIKSPAEDEAVITLLRNYMQIFDNGDLHVELDSMASDPRLKLEVILGLTDELIRDNETCGNRFSDTFWTFIQGIGSSEELTPGDDLSRFLRAEENYHRPFFEDSPFILENYLVNYMFQHLFPFGREGSEQFTSRSIFEEWLLMTTQFAWVNALLIGIAAYYKESFAEEHVVRTVQSFTRAVEHYPDVLNSIIEHITIRRLNSLEGMAIVLKS
jgi:lysine-N-methylase